MNGGMPAERATRRIAEPGGQRGNRKPLGNPTQSFLVPTNGRHQLTAAIDDLARQIGELTETLAPSLLNLFGCGPLSAAKIVAETAGIERFRSQAAFAAHNGTAPIPVWSGNVIRHRLNRGSNRQLNAALHRIAITQLRCASLGHAYVDKRLAAGDTKTEAIRALRRRLSDEVYRRLQADEAARPGLESVMRVAA